MPGRSPLAGLYHGRDAVFGFFGAMGDGFGKLLAGTRRHNLVYVDELSAATESEGLRLTFALPAGSYATVFSREVMKTPSADEL